MDSKYSILQKNGLHSNGSNFTGVNGKRKFSNGTLTGYLPPKRPNLQNTPRIITHSQPQQSNSSSNANSNGSNKKVSPITQQQRVRLPIFGVRET